MDIELTTTERTELEQHEAVIERGLQKFYEVGMALLAIRANPKFYRQFGTFEDYCNQRFGLDYRRGKALLDAAEIVNNLKSDRTDQILPENEWTIRPLVQLESSEHSTVWQKAIEIAANGSVKRRHVEAAVQAIKQVEQGSQSRRVLHSSESNEWYTPRAYIDAVIILMGAIDLDPASSKQANETVGAADIFTIDDDGLTQDWYGRVFLNPPYGRDNGQENWSRKLVEEFAAGNVTEAVLLVNAVTDTKWFQRLWNYPICFTDHRISFYKSNGNEDRPTHGNAFVYLGTNTADFIRLFAPFGAIVQRIG